MAAGAKRRLQHLPRAMCSRDPLTPSLPAQHLPVPGEGKPTATWHGAGKAGSVPWKLQGGWGCGDAGMWGLAGIFGAEFWLAPCTRASEGCCIPPELCAPPGQFGEPNVPAPDLCDRPEVPRGSVFPRSHPRDRSVPRQAAASPSGASRPRCLAQAAARSPSPPDAALAPAGIQQPSQAGAPRCLPITHERCRADSSGDRRLPPPCPHPCPQGGSVWGPAAPEGSVSARVGAGSTGLCPVHAPAHRESDGTKAPGCFTPSCAPLNLESPKATP